MKLTQKFLVAASALLLSSAASAACPKGTTTYDKQLNGKETCVLSGLYVDDLYLSNDKSYMLQGGVFVGADNGKGGADMVLDTATLTIQAGTTIYALNPKRDSSLAEAARVDRKDFLVISRGSKIIAEGTEDAPIVFTSAQNMHLPKSVRKDERKKGDWGGLFIDGQAPVNKCADLANCSVEGEAGTGYYGGNISDDDSGILRYVRVEFGGDKINEEKEFNGITLNAVGSGTLIEYVQIHKNNDDGIEFFGGTANVKYLVVTGAGDDSIDWTYGYQGMIQYALVIQDDVDADRGIEADNDKSVDKMPRSHGVLSNVTLIGSAVSNVGLKFRRGTNVTMTNSIVTGFAKSCADTKGANTLKIFNNIFSCADFGHMAKHNDNYFVAQRSDVLAGYMPSTNSVAIGNGIIPEDFDLFFDDVDFIGAFGEDDWTQGWTTAL